MAEFLAHRANSEETLGRSKLIIYSLLTTRFADRLQSRSPKGHRASQEPVAIRPRPLIRIFGSARSLPSP